MQGIAKQLEKEKALSLRLQGKGIGEIAKTLCVSKSTASLWCRDIALSPRQIGTLAKRSKHHAVEALLLSAEKQRTQREVETRMLTAAGKNEVGKLSSRDLFMVGLGLYWGEGYKQGNEELGFTNSNPAIIKFYIRWLSEIYGVKAEDLILRVSINISHERRAGLVQKYWSDLLNIPLSQFTKLSLIKTTSKKVYSNKNVHYGTLRVKVRKGTKMRRRILGAISALQ